MRKRRPTCRDNQAVKRRGRRAVGMRKGMSMGAKVTADGATMALSREATRSKIMVLTRATTALPRRGVRSTMTALGILPLGRMILVKKMRLRATWSNLLGMNQVERTRLRPEEARRMGLGRTNRNWALKTTIPDLLSSPWIHQWRNLKGVYKTVLHLRIDPLKTRTLALDSVVLRCTLPSNATATITPCPCTYSFYVFITVQCLMVLQRRTRHRPLLRYQVLHPGHRPLWHSSFTHFLARHQGPLVYRPRCRTTTSSRHRLRRCDRQWQRRWQFYHIYAH